MYLPTAQLTKPYIFPCLFFILFTKSIISSSFSRLRISGKHLSLNLLSKELRNSLMFSSFREVGIIMAFLLRRNLVKTPPKPEQPAVIIIFFPSKLILVFLSLKLRIHISLNRIEFEYESSVLLASLLFLCYRRRSVSILRHFQSFPLL